MSAQAKPSLAELLASLPEEERRQAIAGLTEAQSEELLWDWRGFWARPSQLLPGTPGAELTREDWIFWVIKAGRGFGKTKTGAETVREWARDPKERILMIAPTASDVREVMIEGESGLMACYPEGHRPVYNPTRHLVMFPSGAIGITRSADVPERLRGPQFRKFWWDEMCACRFAREAWNQIMFGFRKKGGKLQGLITTTPKPIDVFKRLVKNPKTIITSGSSYDNRSNISDEYYDEVIKPYEGTRLGRQEIEGQLLEDVPGALWTRALIDAGRITLVEVKWELIVRIIVAIDPAVTSGEESDETGIVVVALTRSQHVLVLDDLSCRESPLGWARIAIAAYKSKGADRIVGEVNNGGDLVASNIHVVDPNVAFRAVRASRGKAVRAEPVAALYEQGRVHHVMSGRPDQFTDLEDQMCGWVPDSADSSPDRMDALVWGITDLLIDQEDVTIQVQYGRPYQISPV